ncbi:MAG TPA: serine/threonine-protein kinase [Thermoanaerobaculia bacterium]|jgi:serine/threonine-protein kinase
MTTPAGDPDLTARVETGVRPTPRGGAAKEQFAPGTLVADRYRIASLLGSGGMGEVYRADDTRLNQAVALKFLPARFARDPILIERLHDEVRLGRQVAHPNVCRIYDIVDWQGSTFVAMEYVDGEDLSRLLRRIGRLAHDKAVDIARGIAAGLMAAHAKGILHRDLKPANVMIDSRGDAHIMDFGLALAAGEDDGTISGTPAYMAPEQLEGHPASVQSDLYALGLVMYELFTGKRAHSARTLNERVRDITSEITIPSSLIRDIDPAVERIILRCLANDPEQRPRSARAVIESLPGGDPLAAALAAGETPSPRIVAAAGTEGSLSPRAAWTMLAAIVAMVALMFVRTAQSGFLDLLGLTTPPEVQSERALDLLRRLGVPEQRFRAQGFELKERQQAWLYALKDDPRPWERLRRGLPAATFWLRMQREPLIDAAGGSPQPERTRPPQVSAGSAVIELDPRGGLFSLSAVPEESWKPRPLAWGELLASAGLTASQLKEEPASFRAPFFGDTRAAWSGEHPEDGTPIRVEAAAFRGTPVFFRIVAPWDEKDLTGEMPFAGTRFHTIIGGLFLGVTLLGAFLAWRNLRLRRGDRPGAFRLGVGFFLLLTSTLLLTASHAPVFGHEVEIVMMTLEKTLFATVLFALLYITVEPYIRRRWPDRLIAWARLLSGKWRDPMVGRDLLIGLMAGAAVTLVDMSGDLLRVWMTGKPPAPHDISLRTLQSTFEPVAHLLGSIGKGIMWGLTLMTLLMLLAMILRRRALAICALFAILLAMFLAGSSEAYLIPTFAISAAIITYIVARRGLLAAAAMWATFFALFFVPLPVDTGWASMRTLIVPLAFLAAAVWAFRTSLAGQPAFGTAFDE